MLKKVKKYERTDVMFALGDSNNKCRIFVCFLFLNTFCICMTMNIFQCGELRKTDLDLQDSP